jgi:threonine dehydrogenase-like Zn-dependent dehydrogenase
MKAVVFHEFNGPIALESVPDPEPAPDGDVIRVEATGLCRSDWHGRDSDIKQLPPRTRPRIRRPADAHSAHPNVRPCQEIGRFSPSSKVV